MKILTILTLIYAVRVLRWVSLFQQKEYRLDRLFLYLRSVEGKRELLHILPKWSEFSRAGLRRPVRTIRAIVLCILLLLLPPFWFAVVSWFPLDLIQRFAVLFGGTAALYLLIPGLLISIDAPIMVARELYTICLLYLAQQKLRKGGAKVLGITGSYGKTTTKLLLSATLQQQFSVFVTPKSFNTRLSVAMSIVRGYTNQEIAIIEYAAYTQNEIKKLAQWIVPDMAIITGVTEQHLGLFGSTESVIRAKSELVLALPEQAPVFCQAADPGVVRICSVRDDVQVTNYAGDRSAISVDAVRLNDLGELELSWQGKKILTHLVGKHYLINVQGVLAVAQFLGMTAEDITAGLANVKPTSSFIRRYIHSTGAQIIDDGGTSNPKGFSVALELLQHNWQGAQRRILITSGIVDLGDKSNEIHMKLAKQAKEVADVVFYTGSEGLAEFTEVFGVSCVSDYGKILEHCKSLKDTDVVLIEGRLPKPLEQLLRYAV